MSAEPDGLWSVQDAARLFGLAEARLRYWAQTGFVGPSVRQKGRFYYNFVDLLSLKTAIGLVDRGIPVQRVRKLLDALRRRLPELDRPLAQLRIACDGEDLLVVEDGAALEPRTGQLVLSFAVAQLSERLADITPLPAAPVPSTPAPANDPVPETAWSCFQAGLAALDGGDSAGAEARFRRATLLDPALAAAWTNLGNLAEERGERGAARAAYEKALAVDPDLAEARYNLANVLADAGELELAIAEYQRAAPLPDALYNLGVTCLRAGRPLEARVALERFLAAEEAGEWAERARDLMR
jgi:tetratricopeptide (TPR) repeat protein